MEYNLVISAEAQLEETEAYNYYEDIRSGLGENFLESLIKQYSRIIKNPQYFSFINRSKILRDVKIDRFPFVVIYFVSNNNIIVVSVRNTYRRPFI